MFSPAHSFFVPVFKSLVFDAGLWFIPLATFVIVGTGNAVNLTDGLDGLAILPTVMVAGAFAVFAYVQGHYHFASYLDVPFLPGCGELWFFLRFYSRRWPGLSLV